jgi:AcrR family transcriptional regulator
MTQPQTESPRPRKEEILDIATALFAERGYEGTSMNDVAERVGMRKASLFYHFTTKDALYEAVLDRLVSRVAVPLGVAYSSDGTFAERLDTAADALTTVLGERPFAARLLLREAMDWGRSCAASCSKACSWCWRGERRS